MRPTGRRFPVSPQFQAMTDISLTTTPLLGRLQHEYRLNAQIGLNFNVDESGSISEHNRLLTVMSHQAIALMAEVMYGEFRMPLMDAQLALMHGDYIKAAELLNKLKELMFDIEPATGGDR